MKEERKEEQWEGIRERVKGVSVIKVHYKFNILMSIRINVMNQKSNIVILFFFIGLTGKSKTFADFFSLTSVLETLPRNPFQKPPPENDHVT